MKRCGCKGNRRCEEALRLLADADTAWSRWRETRIEEGEEAAETHWHAYLRAKRALDAHLDEKEY